MNLNDLLDAYRANQAAEMSQAIAAVFAHEAKLLRDALQNGRPARAGQLAPDFLLPDAADASDAPYAPEAADAPGPSNAPLRLSDLLRDGPLVLKFYRGRWCPYCTLDLRAFQRVLPDIRALGARLLVVSPQNEHEIALNRQRDRLGFPMVTDTDNTIARQFGITYDVDPALCDVYRSAGIDFTRVNDTSSWTLPLPAVFVIGTDRRIEWAHVDPDYRRRAEPAEVVAQVRRLVQR